MLKKAVAVLSVCASFCFADNFLIGNSIANYDASASPPQSHVRESAEDTHQSKKDCNPTPQRVVIEDINPSSELGQLITLMLKNEKKRADALSAPKPKPKKVAKKPVKKRVVKKKSKIKREPAAAEPHMEIKKEEASKLDEGEKKEADHNENNSSLKKISSSNICS